MGQPQTYAGRRGQEILRSGNRTAINNMKAARARTLELKRLNKAAEAEQARREVEDAAEAARLEAEKARREVEDAAELEQLIAEDEVLGVYSEELRARRALAELQERIAIETDNKHFPPRD